MSAAAAERRGIEVRLDARTMPNINRYMLFLERECGMPSVIPSELWKTFDKLRNMRNRFIHSLGMEETTMRIGSFELPDSTYASSNSAMNQIADFAARLEKAFDQLFYEKQH